MVLSAYETSYDLTLILALVVAFGIVLGGITVNEWLALLRVHEGG